MKTSGELISNITNIKDNGIHPNFILKAKYPNYDKNIYPKLFKVSNQQQLDTVLESVDTDHFLMEFHINESKFYQNSVTKLIKISLWYPPTLESIHIGSYTDLSVRRVDDNNQYDLETFELVDSDLRYAYITKDVGTLDLPKLLDDDYVVLADGTLKSGLDLQIDVDDVFRVADDYDTIIIPHMFGIRADVKTIKEKTNLKIIEDLSQCHGLVGLGKYADIVISSINSFNVVNDFV
jgi:hypothetical protein